jgi:PIN domain nuclease of toxin-antitoxin system
MVLDASAVLALVNAEPGWERVAEALPDAVISAVNLSEVVGKLVDHGLPADKVRALLSGLGLAVVAFDEEAATGAGALRAIKGGRRLSLGDRACLYLARIRREPALTADRLWSRLNVGVDVVLIR